jgi:DNA-binding MarR family transcriptional regulator
MSNSICYGLVMRDPLISLPGYLLRRASAVVTVDLNIELAPFDLRIVECSVLLFVEANANITQSALCRALDIQRANMTPLTARLADRGLIERQQVDGRSQGLVLTSAGAALVARVRAAITRFENDLTMRIPPEHRAHAAPVLEALWRRSA